MRITTQHAFGFCLAGALVCAVPLRAATPEEITDSIESGLRWLVAQQNGNGSWGSYEPVAHTGFAVVKLEDRAFELGYASPFDVAYPYHQDVIDGLNYLFSQAAAAGAPPTATCRFAPGNHETYNTGVAMMAVAASQDPARAVNVPGSQVDGWTYQQVMDACVRFFVATQNPDGGWRYWAGNQPSDNSNTGYAVLGLRYAEAPAYGFNCVIPPGLIASLSNFASAIQDLVNGDADDGGSQYTIGGGWVNLLKTGNLLFEMSMVGDTTATPRVQDAIDYIERHWNDNNPDPGWRSPWHYQSMYCMMKGLESLGIDELTVGGSPMDWYDEFATAIVGSQQIDGSWPGDNWGNPILTTAWALLVLEKVAPPPPVEVEVAAPACACDTGYELTVTVTVERFTVEGTLEIYQDGELVATEMVEDLSGTATWVVTVPADTPGVHTWKAVLDVTPVGGGTPAHAEDQDSLTVCETPQVTGIPDQVAPFVSFDLDDYLNYGGALPVTWSVSGVPADWTVSIDAENVVTVVPPAGAPDPVDLTFTASVVCCANVVCAGSDTATFVPNQPPDCSGAFASLDRIWPPNHSWVPIQILGVVDPDGDALLITITSIFQDEPVDTYGDGKFTPDGDGVGTDTAWVRAERAGTKKVPGNGRAYHITFTADDGRGGVCDGEVLVGVPHDVKDVVMDEGALFDSTALSP